MRTEGFYQEYPEAQKMPVEEAEWAERKWIVARFVEGGSELEVRAREGFGAAEEIKKAEGPTVEVAGPTDKGFFFHDFRGGAERPKRIDLFKERKSFISNLFPGTPEYGPAGFVRFMAEADFIADARKLPVKEGGIAVMFCSCLGPVSFSGRAEMRRAGLEKTAKELKSEIEVSTGEFIVEYSMRLREEVIQEARRVLKDGGFLIWQGSFPNDLKFALNNGFILLQIEKYRIPSGGELAPKMIFQKQAPKEK